MNAPNLRITFFSHYYPPESNAPATRTSEHARIWAKAGADVTVVTSAPNHPRGELYPGFRNCLFQTETRDGVTVARVWTYLAANEGFARRSLNYVSFLVSAVLAAPRLPRPDVYVSTSPQFFCGLAGMVAARLRGRPWVLEVRDLWPESIVSVGAMRKGLTVRLLEGLERLAYRQADHIVTVTDSFVPHIAAICGDASKISVVKNGVDLTLFQRSGDGEAVKARFGLGGRFVAAYVGTHGMAHGLDTILDAALLLKDDPRIGFLMVGDGAGQARLAARAKEMGLSNLVLAGQLPRADMPGIWSATDASLILLRKSDTFRKVLPSKMFEAMAMRCPIVLGVEGEAKELLNAAGAGIAVTPESASELAAAVRTLADQPALAQRFGAGGATHVRAHFNRSTLALRYLDVLQHVVASARHSATRQPARPREGAAS